MTKKEPLIIQGGMGTAISSWKLAKAVSRAGQLGVVSGTALEGVMARRLQMGDFDGSTRRALSHFPNAGAVERILGRYFSPFGKAPEVPFKNVSPFTLEPSLDLLELTVAANFVEVFLAKEGHDGLVGINFLEKIQLPTLPSLYGALLAGVDYVLMGAGIPRAIPAVMDQLILHQPTSLKINVHGASNEDDYRMVFRPGEIVSEPRPVLKRPKFIAIVSSEVLATTLAKKASGHVDGFVVEGPTAGGHNAPPRGNLQLNEKGEPLYGPKDAVNPERIKELGRPFWLAGSYADPRRLQEALSLGAAGIQAGTVFAYCEESGLLESLKRKVLRKIRAGRAEVFTDPQASPTGFPFKIVKLEGSMSEKKVYEARPRLCDLGYLRQAFKRKDGTVGFRCPGEPIESYLHKGGQMEDTPGRKCLCNGLMANIGLPQVQKGGYVEKPLITSGDDLPKIARFLAGEKLSYSAADVIQWLLGVFQPAFS